MHVVFKNTPHQWHSKAVVNFFGTLRISTRGFKYKVTPVLSPDDCRSTSMGAGGEDVQLSPLARSLVSYTIECKNRKAVAVFKDYEQAKTHGLVEPLVILKQNNSKPLALVDAEHFLDMLQKLNDLKHQVDVLLLVKGK